MLRTLRYGGYDRKRLHKETERSGDIRSEFQKDRDRIIHSFAFRRLQGKNLVMPTGEADFFRTRLTHSLEVSQIGRAIAVRMGANPDLVEAVALAHDLGRPPFGHKGEIVLNELMKEAGSFDAEAQTIRILTEIEGRTPSYRGLNLTRATLDGLLKSKRKRSDLPASEAVEHFFYDEDKELIEWVDRGWKVGLQSLECKIIDWADQFAYAVHDFEDAVKCGFVQHESFTEGALLDDICSRLEGTDVAVDRSEAQTVVNQMAQELWKKRRRKVGSRELKEFVSSLIHQMITAVRIKPTGSESFSVRYQWTISIDPAVQKKCTILQKIVSRLFIDNPRLASFEFKAEVVLEQLFGLLIQPEYMNLLPEEFQFHLKKLKNDEKRYARLVCDYISGMTDRYAMGLYLRLFDPRHGYPDLLLP